MQTSHHINLTGYYASSTILPLDPCGHPFKVAIMGKCPNVKKINFPILKTKKSFSVSETNFDDDPRL